MAFARCATPEGTARYRQRLAASASGHFRLREALHFSSIGIGTYLGDPDPTTDELYRAAVVRAVELGANVIDTAINYRFQRSERAIGAALRELGSRGVGRDEIVLATKGGFIPFDGAPPRDPRAYFSEAFVRRGIASFDDVVAGCHCMTPRYLRDQLATSLANLGVECVDIYYVHNPETQLGALSREEFYDRLARAFEALEEEASAGRLRVYGTATWNAYRVDPDAQDYVSLADVLGAARRAGGDAHHFRAIQLPLNLAMPEALVKRNQALNGERLSALEAAERLGLVVFCSATVLQGQLAHRLPPDLASIFAGCRTDAQRALQFVRSTPGVTTALVGMRRREHVEENLELASLSPTPWEQYRRLFQGG